MKKNNFRLKKLNNKGSALVVVVIVIAFITILATLILYLSVMNYHMKGNDYRTKVSFYGAEIPLEELRVSLAVEFSKACDESYKAVLTQYGNLVDGTGEARKAEFVGGILTELKDVYDGMGGDTAAISAWIKDEPSDEYHVITGTKDTLDCTVTNCECDYHIILVEMDPDPSNPSLRLPRLEIDKVTGKAVLKNIRSVYTKDGYTSVITTDICFMIPEYDWSVEESKVAWVDGTSTNSRTKINYEKCVVYLNWTKQ